MCTVSQLPGATQYITLEYGLRHLVCITKCNAPYGLLGGVILYVVRCAGQQRCEIVHYEELTDILFSQKFCVSEFRLNVI